MLWAQKLLPRMLAAVSDCGFPLSCVLRKLNEVKVVVTTSYSGLGVPEIACSFLQNALQKQECSPEFVLHGCRDVDVLCRKMLIASRFHSEHVFGDILETVSPECVQRLQQLQGQSRFAYDTQAAGRPTARKRELAQQIGRDFAVQALRVLESSGLTRTCSCHCYNHVQTCPLWPSPSENTWHVEVGGNTCTPWSTQGKHGLWLDEANIPCLVWFHGLRVSKPSIIINECTPNFVEILQRMMDEQYISATVVFGPVEMGIPCSRPRRFTVLVRRDLCKRQRVPPLILFEEDRFLGIIAAKMVANADMFLRATPQDVQQYAAHLAKQRGVALPDDVILASSLLLSPWLRNQLTNYRSVLNSKGKLPLDSEFFVDLSQSAYDRARMSHIIPCLLRNSVLFAMKANRPLTPAEYFCVQCLPITLAEGNEFARAPCFFAA